MGDYGFRISKTGQDVKTCTDLNTVVTSKYACLKGSVSGSGSTTVTSPNTNTITIAHNLGYIPLARVYVDIDNAGEYSELPLMGRITVLEWYQIYCYCDATNLYILFSYDDTATGAHTFPYKYYIYKDKGKI